MSRGSLAGIQPTGGCGISRSAGSAAVISLLALLLCLPARARQQAESGVAKVDAVTFSGSKRFSSDQPELARAIGLAPGSVVGRPDIQVAADRLSRLGWFAEVQYKFESNAKGVSIHFTLRDAPCHPVWFDNFPWFSDQDIAAAIRAAGLPFDGTAPEEGTALDGYREAIAGLLRSKHIAGQVEGELIQAPNSESTVERFHVTGDTVWVSSVEFSDAAAGDDPALRASLDSIVGKPYSRYNLALFLIEHVRPAYTMRGYLQVQFGEPVAEFIGDPNKPLSDHVAIRVPVAPGVLFHWGGATWTGNVVLSQATLDGLLALSPGAPADGMKLQAGWERVAAEYAKRGYLEAKVEPVPQFNDAEGRVSYSVHLSEGIQYRMGQLVLTGLSLSAERELLAHWKISPGDIFDDSYYQDFLNGGAEKLFKGTLVRFDHIGHMLRKNPNTKTVDVLLDFH